MLNCRPQCSSKTSGLNRWLYDDGAEADDHEAIDESREDENVVELRVNLRRQSLANQEKLMFNNNGSLTKNANNDLESASFEYAMKTNPIIFHGETRHRTTVTEFPSVNTRVSTGESQNEGLKSGSAAPSETKLKPVTSPPIRAQRGQTSERENAASNKLALIVTKEPERISPLTRSLSKPQKINREPAKSRAPLEGRRPSLKSVDPRIMWEKKLADAEKNEKQAHLQVTELQRKVVSLEDRLRAIKNARQRSEKKQPSETLESKIANQVGRLVQDREIDADLMGKLSDAVSAAVAQTLLAADKRVAPPRRLPPTPPCTKSMALAQT